jgi:hypothetical protein
MKKDPKRIGATIERSAVKRFLQRLRKCHTGTEAYEVLNSVEAYLMKRFDRISKKKGGL